MHSIPVKQEFWQTQNENLKSKNQLKRERAKMEKERCVKSSILLYLSSLSYQYLCRNLNEIKHKAIQDKQPVFLHEPIFDIDEI